MTFPYLDETKELNEAARAQAGGSFILLPDGMTHYELSGNENGRVVVLVHGFSVPYFIFDPTFDFLVRAGFRVLRYDLFGRGFSDRPRLQYDIHLFVRQLKHLLDALHLSQISLIGLSMGGPITAAFLCAHPQMVRSHVMIDPSGAQRVALPALVKAARVPLLGELALGLLGSANMVKGIAVDLFNKTLVEKFQAQYKIQMQYKGFKRAILSTMRGGMLDSFYDTYQIAGKLNKPTFIFWGRQDATIPYEHSALICRAIPHAQLHTVENCGHIPHYEKPQEVHPILLAHLES